MNLFRLQDVQEFAEGNQNLRSEIHRPRKRFQPGARHQNAHHLRRTQILAGHRELGRREEGSPGQSWGVTGKNLCIQVRL